MISKGSIVLYTAVVNNQAETNPALVLEYYPLMDDKADLMVFYVDGSMAFVSQAEYSATPDMDKYHLI